MTNLAKILLSAVAAIAFVSSAFSQTTYNNSTAFFNAITSSNYTENFNSLPAGQTNASPLNFSNNGFQYTAQTGVGPFYFLNSANPDLWLSTYEVTTITFTNISPNVTAIGGNFFATGFSQNYTNTPIGLQFFFADSTSYSTSYTPSGTSSYFGITYNTNITALVISNVAPAAEYMTVNNFTVGVVPEPSTYALLALSAAGLAGYVIRRRRS